MSLYILTPLPISHTIFCNVVAFQCIFNDLLFYRTHSIVLRFGGKHIFKGQRFLFLLYVQNKYFWSQKHLGVTKNVEGALAPNAPVATGLCTVL